MLRTWNSISSIFFVLATWTGGTDLCFDVGIFIQCFWLLREKRLWEWGLTDDFGYSISGQPTQSRGGHYPKLSNNFYERWATTLEKIWFWIEGISVCTIKLKVRNLRRLLGYILVRNIESRSLKLPCWENWFYNLQLKSVTLGNQRNQQLWCCVLLQTATTEVLNLLEFTFLSLIGFLLIAMMYSGYCSI